jgi:hypothetical protein
MPTPLTPTAPDPAAPGSHASVLYLFEVAADMESLHPADARESLFTLPEAEPEPALSIKTDGKENWNSNHRADDDGESIKEKRRFRHEKALARTAVGFGADS